MFGVNKTSIEIVENVFDSFENPSLVAGLEYTYSPIAILLSLIGNTFIIYTSFRFVLYLDLENFANRDPVCCYYAI